MARPKFTPIDQFTLAGLRAGKSFETRIRQFHWRLYAELAEQRSRIADRLHKAILEAAVEDFSFVSWQRMVKARWALRPLSAGGSLVLPGGRFNIGAIDPSFADFPALYVAVDKVTTFQEVLGQDPDAKGRLTPFEIALTSAESVAIYSVSGHVHTVIRLDQPDRLQPFIDIIKGFTLSPDLNRQGRELVREMNTPPRKFTVTTVKDLLKAVLVDNWREIPVQLGIPSTSQLFGQLVAQSDVEAIVYPSRFNDGLCMAVFPQTLATSDSYVALDHDPPRKDVVAKLDRHTWQALRG